MGAEATSFPVTRFPSFSGEWMPDRLGEWFSSSRAKGFGGIPTLSVTVDRGLVNREDLERKQETNLSATEHLLVRDGDIVYNTMRMWQGAFGRATEDGIVSPAYVVLRGKPGVDTRFFEYAFRRSRSIYLFWAYSYGLTNDRLRLYANDFNRIPFAATSLPEQQKIADFLMAVDGRVGQLVKKKALLEDYKKGAMQQIFTQAIRFKDDHGNDFPDWEQKKLGELFTSSRAKGKKGLPTLSVTVNRGLINRDELKRKTESNLREEEHLLVEEADIAYNTMRMWQGAFGRATTDGIVSPAYVVLRGKPGVDTHFFEYAFRTPRSIYLFWAYSYGLTNDRLRLYSGDFNRIPFELPSLLEQRKIANFLSAIDRRIESVAAQITETETFKRGLLQQMFV